MNVLWYILFTIFVIDGILLIIAILLQSGRGGGLAGALGGIGSPDSALGVRAASQIEKATGVMIAIMFACAITLAFLTIGKSPWSAGKSGESFQGSAPAGVSSAMSPAAAVSPAASVTPGAGVTESAASSTAPVAGEK